MKAISLIKALTAVLFFLFTMSAAAETSQQCKQRLVSACIKNTCTQTDATAKNNCLQVCRNDEYVECNGLVSESDAKEQKKTCDDAMKSYREGARKAEDACASFVGEDGKDCKTRANECGKNFGMAFDSDSSAAGESGEMMLARLITQQIAGNPNGTAAQANGQCVTPMDPKEVISEKEKIASKRQSLMDKIHDEEKKQADAQSEYKKKQVEVNKGIAELEKDLQKAIRESDAESRKEKEAIARKALDAAKDIRSKNNALVKINQQIAKEQMEYNNDLMNLTTEDAVRNCKSQIMALKNGIVNSGKLPVDPKDASASQMKALADQIGKGTAGTAELKALLNHAKKKCFESESTKKKNRNFAYSQKMAEFNNMIKEVKADIEDVKKGETLVQQSTKAAEDASVKKKDELTQMKIKEEGNLSQEVSNAEQDMIAKMQNSQKRIAALTQEIQELVTRSAVEAKTMFRSSVSAIASAEDARLTAWEQCGCAAKDLQAKADKKTLSDGSCSALKSEADSYGFAKKKAGTAN